MVQLPSLRARASLHILGSQSTHHRRNDLSPVLLHVDRRLRSRDLARHREKRSEGLLQAQNSRHISLSHIRISTTISNATSNTDWSCSGSHRTSAPTETAYCAAKWGACSPCSGGVHSRIFAGRADCSARGPSALSTYRTDTAQANKLGTLGVDLYLSC